MATPNRIRIGNQTSCNVGGRLPYEFALRHGFDAFEWFSDKGRDGWCEDDMDAAARLELRRIAAARDLLFSVHAPYAADPLTREGAAAIRKSLDFARDVAAGVVNIHIFPGHGARAYAESLGPLIVLAAGAGVRLSLENTCETTPEDVNAVFDGLSGMPLAAGRVGLCFDMGHANLAPGTHNDYLEFLDRLGDHVPIIHWHAHENRGGGDDHLTLFTGPSAADVSGPAGVADRLLRRAFHGSVVLEQWPDPPELLVTARRRLREMLGSRAAGAD